MTNYADLDLDNLTVEELKELQKQIDLENKNYLKPNNLKDMSGELAVGTLSNIDTYLNDKANENASANKASSDMQGYHPAQVDSQVPNGLTPEAIAKYNLSNTQTQVPKEDFDTTGKSSVLETKNVDTDANVDEDRNKSMYDPKRNTYDLANLLNKQSDLELLKHRRWNAPAWNPKENDTITDKLKDTIANTPDGNEPFNASANRLALKRTGDLNMLKSLRDTYNQNVQLAMQDTITAETSNQNNKVAEGRLDLAGKDLNRANGVLEKNTSGIGDAIVYDENGFAMINPNYNPLEHKSELAGKKLISTSVGTEPAIREEFKANAQKLADDYNSSLSRKMMAEMDYTTSSNMNEQAQKQFEASKSRVENSRKQHNDFAEETPFKSIPESKGTLVFNEETGEVEVAKPTLKLTTPFHDEKVNEDKPEGLKSEVDVSVEKEEKKEDKPEGLKTKSTSTSTNTSTKHNLDSEEGVTEASKNILFRINSANNYQRGVGSYAEYPSDAEISKTKNAIQSLVRSGKVKSYHPEFNSVGYSSDNFNEDFSQTGTFNRNDTKLLRGVENSVGITIGGIETNGKVALAKWNALGKALATRGAKVDDYYSFITDSDKNGNKIFKIVRK